MLPHQHAAEFRRCLAELDVEAMKKLWQHVAPGLPQPRNDTQVLVMMHRARTEARSSKFAHRAYSHRWLVDNGHESGLPDALKPTAERLYPKVVGAVGLSVNFSNKWLRPLGLIITKAMNEAIMHEYAFDRVPDPAQVKRAMFAAKDAAVKGLGLPTG